LFQLNIRFEDINRSIILPKLNENQVFGK